MVQNVERGSPGHGRPVAGRQQHHGGKHAIGREDRRASAAWDWWPTGMPRSAARASRGRSGAAACVVSMRWSRTPHRRSSSFKASRSLTMSVPPATADTCTSNGTVGGGRSRSRWRRTGHAPRPASKPDRSPPSRFQNPLRRQVAGQTQTAAPRGTGPLSSSSDTTALRTRAAATP